ncbi:DUF4129 domain-containing transglutaminase family protein [Paenibacillus arenilitoris]|uniref:Transglutaminase domain-containing protein n=1 Tax=Paenibacillus arenilitoris TaxID=2772299 RepID=A0A927CQW3_9BACL|nr:transglutaminase domain-containing protein [Paenibacillus arenilitoris]MBD2872504.1 transglutaminase domain-containing protein [Paenibacillus arenilitoris]
MKRTLKPLAAYLANHWYTKLIFIFVAVILTNTIAIFEDYWWEETYRVAYCTIFAALAVDLLLPLRWRLAKLLVQAAAAVYITTRFSGMEWLISRPERWQEWIWWLQAHTAQLHPFIWISCFLLLIYALFASWTTTRVRMFGLIGVSLLTLTIADSFTPIWLWDEVGMVVFIGLLWLVAAHLSKLQREHPSSWKELLEYPLQLIVPIALVLTVLMAVGLNMPSLSPLLQDPYTLWKQSKGESVQVFLGDKGTEAAAPGSTGDASSGYSRSDEQLGGGFEYDYSPMMTISTSHRSYWRGESKAFYSGAGWTDDGDMENASIMGVGKGAKLPTGADDPVAGTIEVNQIVTMIRKDVYPVLFAAAPVTRVNWIGSEEANFPSDLAWAPDSWELRLLNWSMQRKRYPESYSVTSTVALLDEEKLRAANAGWSDRADAVRNAYYLQLPDSLPQRVRDLAEEATAEGTNDYDKARLLESYLRLNFTYNNKPDLTKLTGDSGDFVDQFLFELKEGYCDYFSTSMAVMARSLGLPARWVKGFAPGTLPVNTYGPPGDYLEEDINPAGAGTYTVRNSDAHSWVEIYFEGFGWVPFEATAGFTFPNTFAEEEPEVLPETEETVTEAADPVAIERESNAGFWLWSSAALLAAAAAYLLFVRRKQIVFFWRKLRHGSYTNNDRMVIETQKLLRICRKRGLERSDHETLREAVLRWSQSRKRLRDDFRAVLDGFEQAKYGRSVATAEEADRFVVKVRSLIDQLR